MRKQAVTEAQEPRASTSASGSRRQEVVQQTRGQAARQEVQEGRQEAHTVRQEAGQSGSRETQTVRQEGGAQAASAEFGDATQYQELNPIGEGNSTESEQYHSVAVQFAYTFVIIEYSVKIYYLTNH